MSERLIAEELIQQLHAARLAGDLAGMCRAFADDGRFEILATGTDKSLAIQANSLSEFRPWLAMMTEDFRLTQYNLLSLTIEWICSPRSPASMSRWKSSTLGIATRIAS